MVAERCLSALQPETAAPPSHLTRTMAAEALGHMMAGEVYVPTMIVEYPDPGEEVEGAIMVQMTCQALAAGQALMCVGGYIVRGLIKSCGRRATAMRRPNGAFEMVPVEYYSVLRRGPERRPAAQQQRPLPLEDRQPAAQQQLLPMDDVASAASFICLAIQSPAPAGKLFPAFEAHATLEDSVDVSELPYQERRDLFEVNVQQPQQQQQQQQTTTQQQMKFDNGMAAQKLASYEMGNRPLRPTDHDNDQSTTIQAVQHQITQLQDLVHTCLASWLSNFTSV